MGGLLPEHPAARHRAARDDLQHRHHQGGSGGGGHARARRHRPGSRPAHGHHHGGPRPDRRRQRRRHRSPWEYRMSTVDVVPILERQKPGRFWFTLFSISMLITFLDGFDFQVLSFAGPSMQKAFHLTDTQLGTLGTIGLFGTLVGGLILGYLAD